MSIGLDIRINSLKNDSFIQEFSQILSAIDLWSKKQGFWHNIKINNTESSRDNCIFQSKSELIGKDLIDIVNEYASLKYLRFYANTAYQYADTKDQNSIFHLSPMAFTFSTREATEKFGGSSEIEGDYSIYFHNVSPYVFPYNENSIAVQNAVDKNLEALLEFLTELANLGCVKSFKVFSDSGDRLPFNAHLAFFSSEASVQEDVKLMRQLWEIGSANYNIPALQGIDFDRERFLTHEWRTAQMRGNLRNRMKHFFDEESRFDYVKIQESGAFDTIDLSRGFMLLEYPHFMNAFLDRFYFFGHGEDLATTDGGAI